MAAPRKYADADRTEVTSEWFEWRAAQNEIAKHRIAFMGPGNQAAYFPAEHGKQIPEEGCWIRVIEEPHTELKSRFRVPELSMWRARRTYLQSGKIAGIYPQLAVITTPGGDLSLWPHEYVLVEDITEWVGMEPDVEMHKLDGERGFSENEELQLFYMQSRGVTRRDASLLLLGDIPEHCYFTLHPDLAAMFAGVGQPIWRHIALHPRADNEPFEVGLTQDEHPLILHERAN